MLDKKNRGLNDERAWDKLSELKLEKHKETRKKKLAELSMARSKQKETIKEGKK